MLFNNSFIKSCKTKHLCLKYTDKSWQKFNYNSSFTWYCCEKFFKIFFIFTWRFCFSFDRSEKKNLSKQNISVKIILTKVEKSKRHVHNIGTKSFFFFFKTFLFLSKLKWCFMWMQPMIAFEQFLVKSCNMKHWCRKYTDRS